MGQVFFVDGFSKGERKMNTFTGTNPIISEITDLDIYKLRILQYYWVYYRYGRGTFAFHNRKTTVRLADIVSIEELRAEIAHTAMLSFTPAHIVYLTSLGGFRDDFLVWLKNDFRLSPIKVEKDDASGQFVIEADGLLVEITLWETLVMRIVIALYGRKIIGSDRALAYKEGEHVLDEKLSVLAAHPRIAIVDFGTRRALCPAWHERVLIRALEKAPHNFVGTSNVMLASRLGISARGTQAHEKFMLEHARRRKAMLIEGRSDSSAYAHVRSAQFEVLRRWYELYGEPLSVALTETFGEDAFFKDATPEFLHKWKGLRLDSGDPERSTERIVTEVYPNAGVDPTTKLVVPSDGLDVGTILSFDEKFYGRIGINYGWGTHFTNAMGSFPTALSIVMKLTHFEDFPTIKLSNNLAKAQGPEKEVDVAKWIYGYKRRDSAECVV